MQNGTDSILKEYQDADFEMRLSLFMTHIDLRCIFIEIDSNELVDKNSTTDAYPGSVTFSALLIDLAKKILKPCSCN